MRTTTLKCDRCGGESTERNFLHPVSASITWPGGQYPSHIVSAEWCAGCVAEMGINKPKPWPKKGDPAPVLPSLESLIREIVREEMYASPAAATP